MFLRDDDTEARQVEKLTRISTVLAERIDRRFAEMVKTGALEEVRRQARFFKVLGSYQAS